MKSIASFCFLCLLVIHSVAQNPSEKNPSLALGIGFHGNAYLGDLASDSKKHRSYRPGASISLRYIATSWLGIQWNIGVGQFVAEGDLANLFQTESAIPNEFVYTNFGYADIGLRLNAMGESWFQPNISLGAGMLYFQPYNKERQKLRGIPDTRSKGELYPHFVPLVPIGAGIEFRISPSFGLGFAYIYRFVGTDYLDNVGLLGTRQGNDVLHSMKASLSYALAFRPKGNTSNVLKKIKLGNFRGVSRLGGTRESPISPNQEVRVQVKPTKDKEKKPNTLGDVDNPPKEKQGLKNKQGKTEGMGEVSDGLTAWRLEQIGKTLTYWSRTPAKQHSILREKAALAKQRFLIYEVEKESQLWEVAKKFGVRQETLLRINPKINCQLFEGEKLRVPNMDYLDSRE